MERYRAIIIRDGKLVVMKRVRNDNLFYVFPGGGLEGKETPEQCCKREVMEEFGIEVKPRKMIYYTKQANLIQGYFVCDWISEEIHKTDAEEYSIKDPTEYGTYEPTTIELKDIDKYNLLPTEVVDHLVQDLKDYGTELNRPLIQYECKFEIKKSK